MMRPMRGSGGVCYLILRDIEEKVIQEALPYLKTREEAQKQIARMDLGANGAEMLVCNSSGKSLFVSGIADVIQNAFELGRAPKKGEVLLSHKFPGEQHLVSEIHIGSLRGSSVYTYYLREVT